MKTRPLTDEMALLANLQQIGLALDKGFEFWRGRPVPRRKVIFLLTLSIPRATGCNDKSKGNSIA